MGSGRKKVEMKQLKKENMQTTFSKRRAGIFKKASELCTLTGAEVAIVIFSPRQKVHTFGEPAVGPILDRFLSRVNPLSHSNTAPTSDAVQQLINQHRSESITRLNAQLAETLEAVENENKTKKQLKSIAEAKQAENWWEWPIETLTFQQLGILRSSFEELRKNLIMQRQNLQLFRAPDLASPSVCGGATSSSSVVNASNVVHTYCFDYNALC